VKYILGLIYLDFEWNKLIYSDQKLTGSNFAKSLSVIVEKIFMTLVASKGS